VRPATLTRDSTPEEDSVTNIEDKTSSKVSAVTLQFWIIKVAATTLGETGGDAVSIALCFSGRHLFSRDRLAPWLAIFLTSRSNLVGWL